MLGGRRFKIDAFAESAYRNLECDAIVGIDVMLSATTAITCLARGRRVFVVRTPEEALERARTLHEPVLAREGPMDGLVGFESQAGPASLGLRADLRPLVLVAALAQVLANAEAAPAVYVACLRNLSATVRHLCARHRRVALIGAGYAGELRCEDQLVAAWIGGALANNGFDPVDMGTRLEVERWAEAEPSVLALGKAADYLCRLGQRRELDFVLAHVDDLDLVCRHQAGELQVADAARKRAPIAEVGMASPDELVSGLRLGSAAPREREAEREPGVPMEPARQLGGTGNAVAVGRERSRMG